MKFSILPLVSVWLSVFGCSGVYPGTIPDYGPATESVGIMVENESGYNLTVYAVRDGVETRLGRAPGMRSTSFQVPASVVSGLVQLAAKTTAQPAGRGRIVSEPVPISAGEQVVWRLRDRMGISNAPHQLSLRIFAKSTRRTR